MRYIREKSFSLKKDDVVTLQLYKMSVYAQNNFKGNTVIKTVKVVSIQANGAYTVRDLKTKAIFTLSSSGSMLNGSYPKPS